jgi:hypothetical protein
MRQPLSTLALLAIVSLGVPALADSTTTQSVAQVQEQFKANKEKLKGSPVKVKALYLNSNSANAGGKTVYNIVLVDERGKLTPSMSCYLDSEPKGLMQYDTVVAQGIVGEGFGAEIDKCSVRKVK